MSASPQLGTSAKNKICAKPLRIYFVICASSTRSMSILSLQNEFLIRNSGLRFWIGCSARLTFRIECETSFNESFEQRMRLVRLALKLGVILAADKIWMIAKLDQFGERSVRRCS